MRRNFYFESLLILDKYVLDADNEADTTHFTITKDDSSSKKSAGLHHPGVNTHSDCSNNVNDTDKEDDGLIWALHTINLSHPEN